MTNPSVVLSLAVTALLMTCASSGEEQRRAQVHQYKSDQAADRGEFGVAADEQNKAEDSHHAAVKKSIAEGKPIPAPTQRGDEYPRDGGF
jgi:hypothetical protein